MVGQVTGFYAKLMTYLKDNWGAPLVVGFMALLALATFFSMTYSSVADSLSITAYYVLVVGIVLQLTCFLRSNKKRGK